MLLIAMGCGGPKPQATLPGVAEAVLAVGTPVRMQLLRRMESGRTPEGETFSLVVAEDVKDAEGRVLIAKGAPAQGTVSWSRGGDIARAMANQPARLAVTLDEVSAQGGVRVPLQTTPEFVPNVRLEFTRENTRPPELARDIARRIEEDHATRQALREIAIGLADGQPPAQWTAAQRQVMANLVEGAGLEVAAREMRDGDPMALGALVRGDLGGLLRPEGASTLGAAVMLAGAVESVGRTIEGWFKVRQIVAPIGLEVTGYVAEETRVSLTP